MNKTLIPLIFLFAILIQACSGPTGPTGPQGQTGLDGEVIVGQTFEVEKVNFTSANNFELVISYTDAKVKVVESDAVFVYVLWFVTSDGDPVWRLMPQAIDMPRGVTYNFDYTPVDFRIFIDAPSGFNKSSLAADWTQNQTFRTVIVPSDFTARKGGDAVDFKDYNAVKKYFNLDESKVSKVVIN